MPSDSKKRREAKKKEAAKLRQQKRPPQRQTNGKAAEDEDDSAADADASAAGLPRQIRDRPLRPVMPPTRARDTRRKPRTDSCLVKMLTTHIRILLDFDVFKIKVEFCL